MNKVEAIYKTREELEKELEELRAQLVEANDTIEAIRTGQIDAIIVQKDNVPQLYTLKSADRSYRVFIEKMTEGAVTLDVEGNILYCNSRFANMVCLPLSGVIGLDFERFIAPSSKDKFKTFFSTCWDHDCKGEVELITSEGKTPVQLSLTILELDEGVSLSIILTDLTDQKAAQQQLSENNLKLAEANRALEASNLDLQQFASVASHDLQEPLRKIQIFSSLLREKEHELEPAYKGYLKKIIDSSSKMRALIIDILNYSKLTVEITNWECVDLNEIIAELVEEFELTIHEKKASIIVNDLPCIDVNRGQMRQVFQNILSNALKFSKPDINPVVTLSSMRIGEKSFDSKQQEEGDYFLISIKDNGIGFDEQFLGNVFALFERLNSKDSYAGTGIGLAIAKKIVEKHNGLITACSEEGDGAEFKIILPIKQMHS
jgi:PAS domain S-box-containing protein